ncbi:Uncharacterized protein Rs2_21668 [Raphanus sativus]|nr:Uncharacterized protein Rs2_21668 [Raphanus sativus]
MKGKNLGPSPKRKEKNGDSATREKSSRDHPRVHSIHRSRHASPFHQIEVQSPEKSFRPPTSRIELIQIGETSSPSSLPTKPTSNDCIGGIRLHRCLTPNEDRRKNETTPHRSTTPACVCNASVFVFTTLYIGEHHSIAIETDSLHRTTPKAGRHHHKRSDDARVKYIFTRNI